MWKTPSAWEPSATLGLSSGRPGRGRYVAGPTTRFPPAEPRAPSPLSVEDFVEEAPSSSSARWLEKRRPLDRADRPSRGLWAHAESVALRCALSATGQARSAVLRRAVSMNSVRASAPASRACSHDPKYLPARAVLSANENPRDVDEEIRQKILRAVKKVPFNLSRPARQPAARRHRRGERARARMRAGRQRRG